MGKGTTLVLLLTTTLVLAVKATVDEECLETHSETINSIAEGDEECTAAFLVLTTEDIDVDCTSDVKKRIRQCLNTYEEQWNDFLALCENVEASSFIAAPAPAPTEEIDSSTVRSTPPTSPAEESGPSTTDETTPSAESDSTNVPDAASSPVSAAPIMDATETPMETDWVTDGWDDLPETAPMSTTPTSEETVSVDVVVPGSAPTSGPMVDSPEMGMGSESPGDDSMASESSPSRRLSRRLLIELEEEMEIDAMIRAFDPITRSLLQSENPTCRDLLIQEGPEAFTNNAASVRISLLSLIGSMLLGLILV